MTDPFQSLSDQSADLVGEWLSDECREHWVDPKGQVLGLQGGRATLLTRNGEDLGGTYPEIVDPLAEVRGHTVVIDGEIVAFTRRPDLDNPQVTLSRVDKPDFPKDV